MLKLLVRLWHRIDGWMRGRTSARPTPVTYNRTVVIARMPTVGASLARHRYC
jgi:hypothetical protein